jgi:hypothetical protein
MGIELAGILAQVLPVFALAAIVEIRSLVGGQRDFQKEVTSAASSAVETQAGRASLERLVGRIVRDRAKDAQLLYLVVLSLGVVALGGQEVIALYTVSGLDFRRDVFTVSHPVFTAAAIVALLCLAPGVQGLNSAGQQARFRWMTRRTNNLADQTLTHSDSGWITLLAVAAAAIAFVASLNIGPSPQ